MYVLRHNETGKYVARPGTEHSYTTKLEDARVFGTKGQAETDRCVESESVISLYELMKPRSA